MLKRYLKPIHFSYLAFGLIFIILEAYSNFISMDTILPNIEYIYAQIPNQNNIQIISTSSYKDNAGNFHIIGEANNTSASPQGLVKISSNLYDSSNNLIGNASTYSSVETLRPGELSPFSISISKNEQTNNISYYELSATSQPSQGKPAFLSLSTNNIYLDNKKNPHITGKILNHGTSPQPLVKVIGTFYNNLSQVVLTNTTFVKSENLSQGQPAQFDIEINKNQTKSPIAFFSLSAESQQYALETPIYSKQTFPSNLTNNSTTNNHITEQNQSLSLPGNKQSPLHPQESTTIPNVQSIENPSTDGKLKINEKSDINKDSTDNININNKDNNEKTQASNQRPLSIAGPDRQVLEGESTTLDARKSYDPDGKIVKYSWSLLDSDEDCPSIGTISEGSSSVQKFIAAKQVPKDCEATYELQVTDNKGLESNSDSKSLTTITVEPKPKSSSSDANKDIDGNNGDKDSKKEDNEKSNNDDNEKSNNQRGEYLEDNNGQHYYNIKNCSKEKGSSGGDLSECEDAEKETQQESDQ